MESEKERLSRLNSWKEVAAWLKTSVRTVQRWERQEGLPVHRHQHASVGTVYAYTSEVEKWLASRRQRLVCEAGDSSDEPAPTAAPPRLLVLPFRVLRDEREIDFLSVSLADAITTSLSALDSLVVRSSLAGARYAGEADLERIRREAAVDLVLVGTLLRSGDRLRVSTQLVEADGGSVRWARTVESGLHDIFQLQDLVVRQVIESVAPPLSLRERDLMHRDVPANSEAYELYLRANELAYNFDPAARDLYRRALEADPQYAPAWARLGRLSRIIGKFGGVLKEIHQAEAALGRALELNPDLGVAHNQLAYLEADAGRAEAALSRLLRRAAETRNDPELFAGLVHVCRFCGLLEASLAAHECVVRLDPTVRTSVCHTHFMRGDYQRALENGQEVLGYIGPLALLSLGREKEALALARKTEQTSSPLPFVRAVFSCVRALAEGARAEAVELSERANSFVTHGPEELYYVARHFAWLGEPRRGIAVLGQAVEQGFMCYPAVCRDPWLHALRGMPEFGALLQRILSHHRSAVRAFAEAEGGRILGVPTSC
jgi:eukaryotic-like serine/threonine-protein kinase